MKRSLTSLVIREMHIEIKNETIQNGHNLKD